MDEYKNIFYNYSSRTKRYLLKFKKAETVVNVIKKLTTSVITKNMFAKVNKDSFEIYSFFILEFEFILNRIKDVHPEEAIKIGGIELINLIDFLRTKTWLAERYSSVPQHWDNARLERMMKFKPLPHQARAYEKYEEVKRVNDLRGYLLDAEAGTGKTYISLSLSELLDYDYVIIIAPRQVLHTVWVNSITESLYKQPQSYIVLGENKKQKYNNERFIIMHYEYLDKLLKDKTLLRKFKRKHPMLIVDEFHNFNEITSQRTQNLLNFINYINFNDIALLTGTPIKMSVNELIPLLYIVDKKFPPVADRFKDMYSRIYKVFPEILRERFGLYKERITKDTSTMPPIKVEEYKVSIPNWKDYTLETIKDKIEQYKIKRLAEIYKNMDMYTSEFEKLLNIATLKMQDEKISKTSINKNIKRYKRLIKVIRKASENNKLLSVREEILEAKELETNFLETHLSTDNLKQFRNLKSIMKYPKLKVLGEALGKILLTTRIKCYNDLAKYLNYKEILEATDKKGLIFSNYVSTCDTAYNKCSKQGYKPSRVYGDFTSNLNAIVNQFNNMDDPTNPMIATYKSLSTGVPLTAANIVITLDLPFRMYILDQAIARAWRIGQDKPVLVLIVKLNSGSVFNITDRDNFIINLSEYNVKLITGNELPYDIPKQLLSSEIETDDSLEENTDTVEEELEEVVLENFIKETPALVDFKYKDNFNYTKIKNMFLDIFKFKFNS